MKAILLSSAPWKFLGSAILAHLLCTANAHAQLYKWIDANGTVTYSDTPPPASARRIEAKPLRLGLSSEVKLPYELAQTMGHHPVLLYTTANCPACDAGRKLLETRGIPFSEKTISTSEDQIKLKQIGNHGQLPLLTVGRDQQEGFEPESWHGLLTAAGYPQTSQLPKNYRNPRPAPAAPTPVPDESGPFPTPPGNNVDKNGNNAAPAPSSNGMAPEFHF